MGRSPAPGIIGLVAWLGQAGGESGNSATTHSRRGGVQVKIIIAGCLIDASMVYPTAWFKSKMLTNDVRWHVILVEHQSVILTCKLSTLHELPAVFISSQALGARKHSRR